MPIRSWQQLKNFLPDPQEADRIFLLQSCLRKDKKESFIKIFLQEQLCPFEKKQNVWYLNRINFFYY